MKYWVMFIPSSAFQHFHMNEERKKKNANGNGVHCYHTYTLFPRFDYLHLLFIVALVSLFSFCRIRYLFIVKDVRRHCCTNRRQRQITMMERKEKRWGVRCAIRRMMIKPYAFA